MSDENSSLPTTDSDTIPKSVGFWLYLIFLIPSIICSLIVLYLILFDRLLRHALNNHIIIVVLFIGLLSEVTLYPWILYYYQYNGIWHRSRFFCAIWDFIDSGLYVTQMILFSWATIERHILIFHDRWLITRKKRFYIHYLPLVFILLYCLIYYSIADFFPPCKNYFDDSGMQCYFLCFYDIYPLFMWEMIVHEIIPVVIIVIFSIALFLRVLWQKHRLHRIIQWRKHRKMTIQLLAISLLFIIFFLPLTLMNFAYLCGLPADSAVEVFDYTIFSSYFMTLLLPFVCLLSLPELRKKVKKMFYCNRHTARVVPSGFQMKIITKN